MAEYEDRSNLLTAHLANGSKGDPSQLGLSGQSNYERGYLVTPSHIRGRPI